MNDAQNTLSACLVVPDMTTARVDAAALKRIGAQAPAIFHDATKALAYFEQNDLDVILVDGMLEGLNLEGFLKALRRRTRQAETAVVVASRDGRRSTVLAAVRAGASGYLLRPYTQASFIRHVTEALERHQARKEALAKAAESAAASTEPVEASEAQKLATDLAMGRSALAHGKSAPAIAAFLRAQARDSGNPDALKGLADAWSLRRHPANTRKFLCKAALAFQKRSDLDGSLDCLEALRKLGVNANPFHEEALERMREADHAGAARAYAAALATSENGREVGSHFARACLFVDKPLQTAHAVSSELAKLGYAAEARDFFARMHPDTRTARPTPAQAEGDVPLMPETGKDVTGPLGTVRAAFAVASHTLRTYRTQTGAA